MSKQWWKIAVRAVRDFMKEWSHDNAGLLAAGVSFYTIFSLVPLIALLLLTGSLFFDSDDARSRLVDAAASFTTPRAAAALGRFAETVSQGRSTGATLLTTLLLIASASAVFRHLRAALDVVLDVPDERNEGWLGILTGRLIAVLMVIGILLFLLATVLASSAVASVRRWLPEIGVGDLILWRAADFAISTGLVAILFAVTLKFVPDMRLEWRHVTRGALIGAVTFSAGRFALASWLSQSDLLTSYGAAASLFVILVAVYFAVLTLFAGAEITELIARRDPAFSRERLDRQQSTGQPQRKTVAGV